MTSDRWNDDHVLPVKTRWLTAYTDFLLSVVGLRQALNAGHPVGVAQPVFAEKARAVVDLADELHAHGVCPALLFAGEEAALWRAALAYAAAACWEVIDRAGSLADLTRGVEDCRRAWVQFQVAVQALADGFEGGCPALDPALARADRFAALFADRPGAAAGTVHDRGEGRAQRVDETAHG